MSDVNVSTVDPSVAQLLMQSNDAADKLFNESAFDWSPGQDLPTGGSGEWQVKCTGVTASKFTPQKGANAGTEFTKLNLAFTIVGGPSHKDKTYVQPLNGMFKSDNQTVMALARRLLGKLPPTPAECRLAVAANLPGRFLTVKYSKTLGTDGAEYVNFRVASVQDAA